MPIMRNPFRKQDEVRPLSEKHPQAPRMIDTKGTEYKLSEINDSGVYLPPSPTEKNKNFWSSRSNGSTTSSNPRSILSPDEPFNISRESFDSYRRSFDITARSPVIPHEAKPRASLDSRLAVQTRHSNTFTRPEPTREEEDFEDVGLNDESKPKKRGFFGRFAESSEQQDGSRPASSHHHGFHIGGRRRGQSGTGQELGDMKGSPDLSAH